jgi:hypothetical protein
MADTMTPLLAEIRRKTRSSSVIALAKKLSNKFSKNSYHDLQTLQDLAYLLYIYSENEFAERLCGIVLDKKIEHVAHPAEYIKALKYKFLSDRNEIREGEKYLEEIEEMNKDIKVKEMRRNGKFLLEWPIKKDTVKNVLGQLPEIVIMEIMISDEGKKKEIQKEIEAIKQYVIEEEKG